MGREREEIRLLKEILHEVKRIRHGLFRPAQGLTIFQILGGSMITGVAPGGSATFFTSTLPSGSVLKSGTTPSWSASDPSVTLAPAADGFSVVAGVPAGSTLTSFTLTVNATSVNPDGSDLPLTQSASVPVTAPPPVFATSLAPIDQR